MSLGDDLASGHAMDSHVSDFMHTEQCIPIILEQLKITSTYNLPKGFGDVVCYSIMLVIWCPATISKGKSNELLADPN